MVWGCVSTVLMPWRKWNVAEQILKYYYTGVEIKTIKDPCLNNL